MTTIQAAAAIESCVRLVDAKSNVDVIICPPYLSICKVRELLRNTHIKVGAQDVFWEESGAYTGKISPAMLTDAGATYCIVGHSEMRGRFGATDISQSTLGYFSESDQTVNLKIKALLFHSLNPILCVGETMEERESGKTDDVIRTQISEALNQIEPAEMFFFVVAYEPVWAIGTGQTCSAAEAERVCALIRSCLDPIVREDVRVLYGGSVKASNASELFKQPNVDGGLVGGASLDPGEFSRIVMSA